MKSEEPFLRVAAETNELSRFKLLRAQTERRMTLKEQMSEIPGRNLGAAQLDVGSGVVLQKTLQETGGPRNRPRSGASPHQHREKTRWPLVV